MLIFAGVRRCNDIVRCIRNIPSAVHLDSTLDVVGLHPAAVVHGVHGHRHEVNTIDLP